MHINFFSCVLKIPLNRFTLHYGCPELNRRFKEIVTNKLDFKSKEALITQRDPLTMSKAEARRIRKSILDLVQVIIMLDLKEIWYGKYLHMVDFQKNAEGSLPPSDLKKMC